MSYEAYDPRDAIRQQVGTEHYDVKMGESTYNIIVSDDRGNDVYIPMLLSEDMDNRALPEMPFIEMFNVQTSYVEHNPSATIREMRARLQYNFYFTRVDEITPSTFIKAVRDKLQDVTRSNQEDVTGTWYFNIDVERPQIQRGNSGKTVTYLVIFELEAIYTDRE